MSKPLIGPTVWSFLQRFIRQLRFWFLASRCTSHGHTMFTEIRHAILPLALRTGRSGDELERRQ
jgi:hypothetical protein